MKHLNLLFILVLVAWIILFYIDFNAIPPEPIVESTALLMDERNLTSTAIDTIIPTEFFMKYIYGLFIFVLAFVLLKRRARKREKQ